jgi:hypothetical protein
MRAPLHEAQEAEEMMGLIAKIKQQFKKARRDGKRLEKCLKRKGEPLIKKGMAPHEAHNKVIESCLREVERKAKKKRRKR